MQRGIAFHERLLAAEWPGGSCSDPSGKATSVFGTPFHPEVPGVNLPSSDLLYYFVALLFSGIFHEFGHALAGTWFACAHPFFVV